MCRICLLFCSCFAERKATCVATAGPQELRATEGAQALLATQYRNSQEGLKTALSSEKELTYELEYTQEQLKEWTNAAQDAQEKLLETQVTPLTLGSDAGQVTPLTLGSDAGQVTPLTLGSDAGQLFCDGDERRESRLAAASDAMQPNVRRVWFSRWVYTASPPAIGRTMDASPVGLL
eukprot:1181685-Prorocentrum_minimum.AAC.2